jgi:hypothetical protein
MGDAEGIGSSDKLAAIPEAFGGGDRCAQNDQGDEEDQRRDYAVGCQSDGKPQANGSIMI